MLPSPVLSLSTLSPPTTLCLDFGPCIRKEMSYLFLPKLTGKLVCLKTQSLLSINTEKVSSICGFPWREISVSYLFYTSIWQYSQQFGDGATPPNTFGREIQSVAAAVGKQWCQTRKQIIEIWTGQQMFRKHYGPFFFLKNLNLRSFLATIF